MAITIVNLILTVILLALGIWAYGSKKSGAALLIGIAFGLFAVSHLFTLLDLATALNTFLIIIRIIGYILAIIAVIKMGRQQ